MTTSKRRHVMGTAGTYCLGDTNHHHRSGEVGAFGEARIADGFGGLKRYLVRTKWYKCPSGHKFQTSTNHYDEIYTCPQCKGKQVVARCIELELTTQLKRLEESDTCQTISTES